MELSQKFLKQNSKQSSVFHYIGENLEHEVLLKDGKLYMVASNMGGKSYSFWLVSTGAKVIYISKLLSSTDEIVELADNGNYHLGIKLKKQWQAISVVML